MKTYVKTPVVYQTEAAECGAASLAMVFSFFGHYVPMEQLREETGVSRDGCNAANLCRVAEKYGLESHGYKKSVQGLRTLKLPCILYWEQNHFVVLEGFKGKRVYINDPAYGRRRLTKEEFKEGYAGIVLTFRKTEQFQKVGRPAGIRHVIKSRAESQKEWLAVLTGLCFLENFPMIAGILMFQLLMDEVILPKDTKLLFPLLFGMVINFLAYLLLSYGNRVLEKRIFKKAKLLSLRNLLKKLLHLPMLFFEQRYPDDLAVRVENHGKVSRLILKDCFGIVQRSFASLFYLLLIFLYSPLLALESLVVLAGALLLFRIQYEPLAEQSVRVQLETGKLANMLGTGLRLQETLKIAGVETEYLRKLRGQEKRKKAAEKILNCLQKRLWVLLHVMLLLGIVILSFAGSFRIGEGTLSTGMLFATVLFYINLFRPVLYMAGRVESMGKAKADAVREEDILAYPEERGIAKQKKKNIMEKLDGALEVRNLSFGYNRLQTAVLSDVSVSIGCGERIAFIGTSGAGKSTLLKLLGGMYKPWDGVVLYDGTELEKIPKEVRNASISMVHPKGMFFAASIRENITMWNPNITENAWREAAKDACIHEDITAKSGGYEFPLEENGTNVSGGQRQRIAIARALATNPSVLILDDATGALDPLVEKRILDNIKRRGCTCLIAAQRLSTIRDCDRVFWMENGKIVRQVTQEELLLADGIYCERVKK